MSNLLKLLEKARSARAELETRWERCAKLYDGEVARPDLQHEWQPDVEIPIAWERSMAQQARIVNVIVSQEPPFVVTPKVAEDPQTGIAMARAVEAYLDWKVRTWPVHSKVDFPSWIAELVRMIHIFGTAVVHVFVKREVGVRLVRRQIVQEVELPVNPVDPGGGVKAVATKEVLRPELAPKFVGSCAELVDPRDFFWYPLHVERIEDATVVARRHYFTPWELQRTAFSGFFDADAVQRLLESPEPEETTQGPRRSGDARTGFYEVFECYHWEKNEDTGEYQELITYIEPKSKAVLRQEPNTLTEFRIPFVVFPFEWRAGSFIGPSFIDRISGIHLAINSSVNLELENTILANSVPLATDDDELFDELKDSRLAPGQVLRTSRPPRESLMPIQVPAGTGQLQMTRSYLEQQADMISSTSPAVYGIEQAQRPTFRGTQALIEEAKQPLYRYLETIRNQLAAVAYHMLARDREYFDFRVPFYKADRNGRIFAQQLLEIPDGFLQEMLVVELKASSESMSKQTRQQLLTDAIDRVSQTYQVILSLVQMAQNPEANAAAMVALKGAKAISLLLKEAATEFGIPGADDIAPDPEEDLNAGRIIQEAIQRLVQSAVLPQDIGQQAPTATAGPAGPGAPGGAGPGLGEGPASGGTPGF